VGTGGRVRAEMSKYEQMIGSRRPEFDFLKLI